MSLINDALKKAQLARADQNPPPANPTPPATPLHATPPAGSPTPVPAPVTRPVLPPHPPIVWRDPNSPKPAPTKPSSVRYGNEPVRKKSSLSVFWLSLGAIAIIAISVRVTVMFTRSQTEPTATNKSATSEQPRTEPQTQPAPPQVEVAPPMPTLAIQPLLAPAAPPQPIATPEPVPTITFNAQPAATKPASIASPAATTTPTPAAAATLTVTFPVPAEKPAAPVAAPASAALPPIYAPRAPTPVNPGARIQSFIDRLRVTGIRMSTTGSKVILNDRLFKAGDIVDPALDLRLLKIEEGVLTFADTTGKTYIKLFQ